MSCKYYGVYSVLLVNLFNSGIFFKLISGTHWFFEKSFCFGQISCFLWCKRRKEFFFRLSRIFRWTGIRGIVMFIHSKVK